MSDFNLEKYLENHHQLRKWDGGFSKVPGTVVAYKKNKIQAYYTKDINRSAHKRKNKNYTVYVCLNDIVKDIISDVPKKYMELGGNLTFNSSNGNFIQALHRSGKYLLITTTMSVDDTNLWSLISNRFNYNKTEKIKKYIGDRPVYKHEFICHKVGVYQNNEERVRRKELVIKMLGSEDCLNSKM